MSDVIWILSEGDARVYHYAWWYAALWLTAGAATVLTGFLSHKLDVKIKVALLVVGVVVAAHSIDLFSNEVRLFRDRVVLDVGNWWRPSGTSFSFHELSELTLAKPTPGKGACASCGTELALIAKPKMGSPFVIQCDDDLVAAAESRILDTARLYGVKVSRQPEHVFCSP